MFENGLHLFENKDIIIYKMNGTRRKKMFGLYFGKYLVDKNVITQKECDNVIEKQKNARVKLGLLAVETKLMTQAQADEVNTLQTLMDKRFGDIAVSKGYLTDDQVGQLLKKQGDAYLQFVQTITEEGLLDMSDLNKYLEEFKQDNGYSDEEMEDLKSSDLDKVVPLFTKKAQGMTKDYLSLMVRNLNRFIDTEIRIEELYIKDEVSIDKAACQSMFGDHELFVGFVGGQAGLVHIGSQFAKEEFTEVDEDVLDSICEFINTINGLFASSLSENEIDMDMHPPMMAMDAKVIRSDELFVLPVFLSGKKVELVLALDKKVIVE